MSEIKYGAAAIDPKNPAHWHGLGLPGAFYMDGTRTVLPPQTPAQAARLAAARADFQRRKAAGTLPQIFSPR
jgi:FtsP/CotA-like multicopper oxidase with cupredoxin domain